MRTVIKLMGPEPSETEQLNRNCNISRPQYEEFLFYMFTFTFKITHLLTIIFALRLLSIHYFTIYVCVISGFMAGWILHNSESS